MAPNTPTCLEAHFGVAAAGAVLNALNVRLDAATIGFILNHGEAKVLLTDREFSPVIKKALESVERKLLVIDIDDPLAESGESIGEADYESFLASGDPDFPWRLPEDEWESLSRSEEHTSELQSLMRISYAVFCLQKKNQEQ